MTPYNNSGGNSGVRAYEYGSDYITVQFSDRSVYTYTDSSAGANHIQNMIRLAQCGSGLNSYIMRNVKIRYAKRNR